MWKQPSAAPARRRSPSSARQAPVCRKSGIRTMKDLRTAPNLPHRVIGPGGNRAGFLTLGGRGFADRFSQIVKFAEIGQLAAGIIHEINNPVACLRSNVSVLLEYFPRLAVAVLPEGRTRDAESAQAAAGERGEILREVRQILEELDTGIEFVASVSKNLKSLTCCINDAPEEVDLHECIDAALRVAGHELKYRVQVEKELGSLPRIMAYPGLLIQVFVNLFVNAAQAIDGEGVLRIRTRPEADGVLAEVSDTGCGIAPEHLPNIFRPFFTTKPPGVGFGLGLDICKRIINHHNGGVEVSSSPGEGTMFRIRLPRSWPTHASLYPTERRSHVA